MLGSARTGLGFRYIHLGSDDSSECNRALWPPIHNGQWEYSRRDGATCSLNSPPDTALSLRACWVGGYTPERGQRGLLSRTNIYNSIGSFILSTNTCGEPSHSRSCARHWGYGGEASNRHLTEERHETNIAPCRSEGGKALGTSHVNGKVYSYILTLGDLPKVTAS